ncbi:unnamed protein product [Moneuplotes crassus]|uniref:GAF domain-containing protein n=1 Tax=Euplotes crassus TaxID=5936 RepID=A0AAD1Y6E0_EUPCR|nr:unnamed protein product [Moneuplotes crassus]
MKPVVQNITIKTIDAKKPNYDITFLEKYLKKHKPHFTKRKLKFDRTHKLKKESFSSEVIELKGRRTGSITHQNLEQDFINARVVPTQKSNKKPSSKITCRYMSAIKRRRFRCNTGSNKTTFDIKDRTRGTHQNKKFKISLARSTRKHHLICHSKPVTPIQNRRGLSNRSRVLRTEPSRTQEYIPIELLQKLRILEEEIKKKKHAIVEERQRKTALLEENTSLMKTNRFLTQQDLTTTSSSFTINARVAENIYENFMIKDLKDDLERIQIQIDDHNGKNKYKQHDIEAIKKDNKALRLTVEEVKKYKKVLDTKVKESKNVEKVVKLNDFSYRRNNTIGVSPSGRGRGETSSYGFSGSQELVRIERLTSALSSLFKFDSLLDTFIHCVDEMKRIMNRELKINIYLLDESLYHKIIFNMDVSKSRFLSKGSIDSVSYHVFTNNNTGRVSPSFKNIESIKFGSRSNDVMILPVGNSYSDIMMIAECKISVEVEKSPSRMVESKPDNSSYTSEVDEFSNNGGSNNMAATVKSISITKGGFNILDEFTFKILLEFVKKRIEIITSKKDAMIRKQTGKNLINLLGDIMRKSTLTRLIIHWKEVLPKFFGFKDVGILFYDPVKDDLCAAGEINSEFSQKMVGLDSETVIRFPNTIGVTGQAFKNSSVISRNTPNLNPIIDNISNQGEVANFMIGVILGDEDKKAGILQFINKVGGEDVKNYDIQRFKAMRHFLGSCAENVSLTAVAINLVIMVQGKIGGVSDCLEICDKNQNEKSRKIDYLDKSVSQIKRKADDEIKQHLEAVSLIPELETFLHKASLLLSDAKY